METRKLYYEDCHLSRFTGVVTGCRETDKGYLVTLNQTAFYPEGGGQPCDLGVLADAKVLDVREQGEEIVHLCDKALAVGQTVTGEIDFARRFDFMQQHTGEHIVSGIIHRRFGFHNVGFHIGADFVTIDFDGELTGEALQEIENEANDAIWQNLEVSCRYPDPEELKILPYRSKKELPWPVRIVEIPGYDMCACCGVHTARTAEAGFLKLFSCVKFRQGVRIEMACGNRALKILSQAWEQNKLVSQAFSAKIMETGVAAQRMNDALAREKYRATGLEKQLMQTIAQSYAGQKDVYCFPQGFAPGSLKELAEEISKSSGGRAAVFAGAEGSWQVCIAQVSEDVTAFGKQLTQALHGKGGGRGGFFQGNIQATRKEIEEYFTGNLPVL